MQPAVSVDVEGSTNLDQTSSPVDRSFSAPTPAAIEAAMHVSPGGNYRWLICALLFFATTINYMDRQGLGLLAPQLQRILRLNEVECGYIITAFQTTHAL